MSRDLPPLNALRAFEAAARLGSMAAAAEELHVTHGAVSRQVKLLEDALGTPLFTRHGRGLALTATGRRLGEAAAAAFEPLRRSWAELRSPAAAPALVLGCPGSLLARWMIPRMEQLATELPDLRLHLAASEATPDAALTGMDAALLIGTPPWPPGWDVHRLAPERIGPVLSPRHPAHARLQGAPATALLQEALLHTASRPSAWPEWARRNGLDPEALRLGTGFDHLYYLLEAAAAGLGVAIAPQELVADDLRAGRLVAPWGFTETDGYWALCTLRGGGDARIAPFTTWLRKQLDH
ncbi:MULTISPECIES: LysR family transcriptional regulator [Pseudoxanthomonas]|uniref:DNA-binding transcriptional LysR family regulator n=1 Tax=Pseudoxanthomonas taiwanensis J19 TaxID=935569 RepID=A0A562CWZ3_9GAMM|nr:MULTISPECIES: LysR family transcriptional regulator [Pseudoxanthomonas]TWH01929.1 DNA-binding transcriptional LysR family regulator [Pseudoxanthomonas taiwanensis J19]